MNSDCIYFGSQLEIYFRLSASPLAFWECGKFRYCCKARFLLPLRTISTGHPYVFSNYFHLIYPVIISIWVVLLHVPATKSLIQWWTSYIPTNICRIQWRLIWNNFLFCILFVRDLWKKYEDCELIVKRCT